MYCLLALVTLCSALPAIFALKSHFRVLWRYHCYSYYVHYVWMSCRTPFTAHFAATFTTLGFRKKNLFIIFYYVDYAMFMSKRSKILFQRYVHDAMIRFTLGFVKNTLINCYYVVYAAIMTKKVYFFFSALLHSLHRDDEKKSTFSPAPNCYYIRCVAIMSTTFTTPWWWQKYMFSFQHYVYYMMII